MSSRFNFKDKKALHILIEDESVTDVDLSGENVNAEMVIPSSLLVATGAGVPISISMSAHGKENEALDRLQKHVNKKRSDFDSHSSYVKHVNDLANSWDEVSNSLNALKNSPQAKTFLAKINPSALIGDDEISMRDTIVKKVSGKLRGDVQIPKAAKSSISSQRVSLDDELKNRGVSSGKKKARVSKKPSPNRAIYEESDFPSSERSDVYSADSKTTDRYVGKSSGGRNQESEKGSVLDVVDGRVSVGSDMVFDNYREADASLAVAGKSIANCFRGTTDRSMESILMGTIDRESKDSAINSRKDGNASISKRGNGQQRGSQEGAAVRAKNTFSMYGVAEENEEWVPKKYFIQLPKDILALSDSDINVVASVTFSDGSKKEATVKIITGGKKFVPEPIRNASVSTNDAGYNILSISVPDKNTSYIGVYRRERSFSSNKIKSKMQSIGSVSIVDGVTESKNSKVFTFIDKNVKSKGIIYEYRLVSSNDVGDSYDFYDVVSKPNGSADGSRFKQGRIDNQSGMFLKETGKKITIKMNNIHPSAKNVRLLRKNVSLKETRFTKTDAVLPVGRAGTVEFEDKDLREFNDYEYSYVAEDRFGNVSGQGRPKGIKYQRMISDDPEGKNFETNIDVVVNDAPSTGRNNDADVGGASSINITHASEGSDANTKSEDEAAAVASSGGIVLSLRTTPDQAVLGDSATSDIILDSLRNQQKGDEIVATTFAADYADKKDDLSKNIVVHNVEIIDMETDSPIYSGHIKGEEFDSSRIGATKDMDTKNKQYRVVVTTAAVDLQKHIDEAKRKEDSIREFGTIPSFKATARTILDESVVGVKDLVVGNNRSNTKTEITNVKKKSSLDKHIVTWSSSNDENVDFYIVEKSAMDDSYPWKYAGKTMSELLENKAEDFDYTAGVKYRVTAFYVFNEVGSAHEEKPRRKKSKRSGGNSRGTGGGGVLTNNAGPKDSSGGGVLTNNSGPKDSSGGGILTNNSGPKGGSAAGSAGGGILTDNKGGNKRGNR